MKKTILIFAALLAVCGCRKGLQEPPDWNPEKSLGQRNRAAPQYVWEVKTNMVEDVAVVTTNAVEVVAERAPETAPVLKISSISSPASSASKQTQYGSVQTQREKELLTVERPSSTPSPEPQPAARPALTLLYVTKPLIFADKDGGSENETDGGSENETEKK